MKSDRKSIILNSNCKGGRGLEYWGKISPYLEKRYGPFDTHISMDQAESRALIKNLIKQGERTFISVGGDGGINLIINCLIENKGRIPLSDFTIGAVGLGSSNDYHKPFAEMIQKVPVRLNTAVPILRDVGEIIYIDENSTQNKTYFLISSSVGIVAEGNANFNKGGPMLTFFKKRTTDLAIFWTFFNTLRNFKNIPLEYLIDNSEIISLSTSYLAVSKTQFISGIFHFDEDIQRNDEKFMVKILYDYSKIGLINCLLNLSFGREKGLHNLLTRFVKTLEVSAPDPFILEYDGETLTTRKIKLQMYKQKIMECS